MKYQVLALVIGLSGGAQAAADSGKAVRRHFFPRTKSGIHLEMVFNYGLSQEQLGEETGVVDLVWGSSWATLPPGMYNSAYIPFSVDNFGHDIAWYQTNHPDWLEYQCDRKTLAFEFNNSALAPLDFSNPAVRAYQWTSWIDMPLSAGYQGIAVDTLRLGNDFKRCGHFDAGGNWVQQYSGERDDAAFRADVLGWEAATLKHVHKQTAQATMQVNVVYDSSFSRADNRKLMTTADLLFDERGYTNYGGSPNVPTPQDWATITDTLDYVQSKGLCYMANGEEPEQSADITRAEKLWVIGNYLLMRNDCTYMYMTGTTADGGQDYGKLITFPEYTADVGKPTGPRKKKQGIWQRAYTHGLTLVNPYDDTFTVTLPDGGWTDLDGADVGPTVTLTPQTAQVLLKGS